MISKFKIEGYKKFKSMEIDNLGVINIFVGPNNMGKTSILEGIYGWAAGQQLMPFFNAGVARMQYTAQNRVYPMAEAILSSVYSYADGEIKFSFTAKENGKNVSFIHEFFPSSFFQPLEWIPVNKPYTYATRDASALFLQNNQQNYFLGRWQISKNYLDSKKYEICSDNIHNTTRDLGNQAHRAAHFYKGYYVDANDNLQIYNTLKRRGLLDKFTEELRETFPDIKALDAVPYPDSTFGFVNVEKEDGTSLPIYAYGDGLQKWYSILGGMLKFANGMVCIDEIDAAFHPSMQIDFSRYLLDYAIKNSTQVFSTTHNLEWIDHFLQAYDDEELEEYVRIYKVTEDTVGNPKIKCLTGKDARLIRKEYSMELR